MSDVDAKQTFHQLLTAEYGRRFESDPYYAEHKARDYSPAALATQMTEALAKGEANKDSPAIRAVCRKLGVKYTHKAIRTYLDPGWTSAPRMPRVKPRAAPNDGLPEDFVAGMSPMKRGKVAKTLSAHLSLNGVTSSRREHIERMVAEGWRIGEFREARALWSPEGHSFYMERALSSTALDYAEYLVRKA